MPATRDLLAGWRAARAVPTVPAPAASTGHAPTPHISAGVPSVPAVPTPPTKARNSPASEPFIWPTEVDFHLTETAARLSGEVAAGASWRWCSSGGLDVERVCGRMLYLSPSTAARLREARLLPEVVEVRK